VRVGAAQARRDDGATTASGRFASRRVLSLLACALAVIAGMLAIADQAWRDSDRARQAQVLMERMRASIVMVNAVTWSSLAQSQAGPSSESLAHGFAAYRDVTANLRGLRAIGVSRARTREVEERMAAAYAVGLRALLLSRKDPAAGRQVAITQFTPAMDRLNAAITSAATRQEHTAHSAAQRMHLAVIGSLALGLALLGLLGWRLHRLQRRWALERRTRSVERRSEERLRALLSHSSDVVAVTDASSTVRWLAESVRPMLGYEPDALLGEQLSELVHPEDAHRAMRFLEQAAAEDGHAGPLSLRLRAADGGYRDTELVADNLLADPVIDGILLNLRDVTDRIALEEQLRRQTFQDGLTGLANRALFEDRLTQALARRRRGTTRLAVLFVDLDDFKTVNDSLGHAAGNELLQTAGQRLAQVLRGQDTAARLGGDEFAVLLEDLHDAEEAVAVAERLCAAIAPPLTLAGHQVRPSASVGVAVPGEMATAEELLRNADVAMYAAKERGKGQVASFEQAMHEQAVERLELAGHLSTALERDELVLDYQPYVDLQTGAVAGFEALLRWQHPERGRLAPDRFIDLAETSGLIVPIGRWVLRTACRQLQRWEAAHPWLEGLGMSVNVSARQVADADFAADVRAIIAESGVAPDQITLEITERLLVEDSDAVAIRLRALKEIGVRLAVDDFGTGYSSLSYLQSFPVDILKIDRSFVAGIDGDQERARLVGGIVDMGHSLGLQIVTEGIEEPGDAAVLRDLGSDFGQGYLFSRPIDPAAAGRFLAERLAPEGGAEVAA
jgi:diguanylate cyclase (GGDEF)-like protein/PAS domain S-box-containing protein